MKYALLAVVVGCAIFTSANLTQTVTLSGVVKEEAGFPIVGAKVTVDWNLPRYNGPPKPTLPNLVLQTDNSGRFSIQITPGFYDLCIHAPGFAPTCETIAVGKSQDQSYNAVLKANYLIMREYGDLIVGEPPVQTEPAKLPDSIQPPK